MYMIKYNLQYTCTFLYTHVKDDWNRLLFTKRNKLLALSHTLARQYNNTK